MKLEKEIIMGNMDWKLIDKKYEATMNISFSRLSKEEMKQILKIFENYKAKLTLEVEEPILDETERKYLSSVIKPFRDDVEFICKNGTNADSEYINIGYYKDDNTFFPCFKKGTMYKKMVLDKEYTLEELNL